MNKIGLTFIGVCFSLFFSTHLNAQSQDEVVKKQKEQTRCIFSKKKENKKILPTSTIELMHTKELILQGDNEPLHALNGKPGTKLKVVLYEFWKAELKNTQDSSVKELVDFDKQEVSYLIDVVSTPTKSEIVSITLQVKKDQGTPYATLIFCMEEIKPLLINSMVIKDGKTMSVWDYFHQQKFTSKDVTVVKLASENFPCYFK